MTLTHTNNSRENNSRQAAAAPQAQSSEMSLLVIEDNRAQAAAQRELQAMADSSPAVSRQASYQAMANTSPRAVQAAQLQAMADSTATRQTPPVQRKGNNTGLQDKLKSGIEDLSGINNLPVAQLQIDEAAIYGSDLEILINVYRSYKRVLSNFDSMTKGRRTDLPADVLFEIETWKASLMEVRRIAGAMRSGHKYRKPLEEPYSSSLKEMETELAARTKCINRLMSSKDIAAEAESLQWFLDHMTILPGLELSITAILNKEQADAKKKAEFEKAKAEYRTGCLQKRDVFLGAYTQQAADFNATAEPDRVINPDPFYGLADLNVMHPHTPAEGQLIVDIDQLNSAFNVTISEILKDDSLAGKHAPVEDGVPSEAKDIDEAGGVVEAHSKAFQSMLSLRGSAGVTIRPAGKHSVGLLKDHHPAKPLWVKGKTIDLSKLTPQQLNTLRRYMRSVNPSIKPQTQVIDPKNKAELIGVLNRVLKEGLIPADQLLSKWLRDIEIGLTPPELTKRALAAEARAADQGNNAVDSDDDEAQDAEETGPAAEQAQDESQATTASGGLAVIRAAGVFLSRQVGRVREKAKAANAPIVEMREAGLIIGANSGMDTDQQQYVSPPGANARPYTGDYDMYGINRAAPGGRDAELQNLTTNARKALGQQEGEAPAVNAEQAHRPMAETKSPGRPDGKHAHKLFGNISPFEIGMMLDLNAAATAWGGYKGGQVIKHGAESGNFQYPQSINDGIVSVGPDHVNFDSEIKDDAKGVNFPLVLAKLACSVKQIDFPLNSTLNWLYKGVMLLSPWQTAASDDTLFNGKTINMKAVKAKIGSDPNLAPVIKKVKQGIAGNEAWIGNEAAAPQELASA